MLWGPALGPSPALSSDRPVFWTQPPSRVSLFTRVRWLQLVAAD